MHQERYGPVAGSSKGKMKMSTSLQNDGLCGKVKQSRTVHIRSLKGHLAVSRFVKAATELGNNLSTPR